MLGESATAATATTNNTMMEYNLPGVLHYLQAEWRRFERERNEWTIERAELLARIALLEGERRGVDTLKTDLMKRVKMLEYALRQERKRHLGSIVDEPPKNVLDDKVQVDVTDIPNITAASHQQQRHQHSPTHNITAASVTGARMTPSAEAVADTNMREKSRQALKTCLQEINYLTSLPSKLPLTYTLANATRNNSTPSQRPSPTPTNVKSKQSSKPQQRHRVGHTATANSSTGTATATTSIQILPQSPILTNKKQTEEEEQDEVEVRQPPSPPTTSTPVSPSSKVIDNVDEVAMLNNIKNVSSSSSSTPSTTVRSETNHDGLAKEMQEKYNLPEDKVQKLLRNASKGTKRTTTRSVSPDPQEVDFDFDSISTTSTAQDVQAPKIWKAKMTFKGHLDSVRAVGFHPSEMLVASGSDDGTVKLVNLQRSMGIEGNTPKKSHEDLDATTTYRGHTNIVTAVAIAGEQNRVYSSSLDATIRVWRLPSERHTTFSPVDPSLYITTFVGHTDAIWDFKLSPTCDLLASASADGKVKVWDTQGTGELLKQSWSYCGVTDNSNDGNDSQQQEREEDVAPTCVDFMRTNYQQVVVSYTNAKIRLFDIETGKVILTFIGSDDTYDSTCKTQINKVASHPTMPLIVSGHEDRYIQFFDINSGKSTFKMSAHLDAVTCLDMDPSGMTFVSGGHDASIRVWDMAMTKTCVQEFAAHRKKGDEGVLDIQYHRKFPWMVSGGADGIVKMYHHGQ